ncbi:MAG: lactate utilization protein [Candidatus Adiutrix sp.]|jgi:L-lactate dehydrogenase complex protein LldG|nr:lactate utilization protein [Candidatus Adiutrix sp.]
MSVSQELVAAFTAKAELVGAKVTEAAGLPEALARIVDICERKKPGEWLLPPAPGTETGPLNENGLPTRLQRLIAAPDLAEADFAALEALAAPKGFLCLRRGLRDHLAGFDVGVAQAAFGVAASGTCALDSTDDDARLATMLGEDSVVLLRKADLCPDLAGVAGRLRAALAAGGPVFQAFVTGPSRTADIERVLTLGVHGPFELHIILLEG